MKSLVRPLAVLLVALGLEDLIMVPVMVTAHNQPPMAATVLSGVLGAATLASLPGLAQGHRWAFRTAIISRIVDAVNSLLGTLADPEAVFKVVGAVTLVLSIATIVLLVRFSQRGAARVATSA